MRWPHLEGLAVAALGTATGKRVATRVPNNLEQVVADGGGFYRIARGPGGDDGITDSPLLDVEAFAADESTAWNLAEDARQVVRALRGKTVNGVLVDTVDTATGPVLLPWGSNTAVQRYVASYRFAFRQQ